MQTDRQAAATELGADGYGSAVENLERARKNYQFVMWFCVGASVLWAVQRDRARGFY